MSNIFSSTTQYFEYEDGTKILAQIRIDRKTLGKIVYEISKNKKHSGKRGALYITVKDGNEWYPTTEK